MSLQTALPLAALGVSTPMPDLVWYDIILFNSSAGKDSQAALDWVVEKAQHAGAVGRIVVVHADLGEMEWPGTKELAAEHAASYGLRFEVVSRRTKDGRKQTLLEQIEERGMFPDSRRRYCTSDHKRSPVRALMTRLVDEQRRSGLVDRPVRLLNILGTRAEESTARALKQPFRHDGGKTCTCSSCRAVDQDQRGHGASNSRRHVDEWLPVHGWTEAEVWERITEAGTRTHWAYAAGMPRLSCRFCVLASKSALVLSARLNPELAAQYAEVERRTGHHFKADLSMTEIIKLAQEARTGEG